MCIFKSIKFQIYPEQTQLHLDYQQPDETARAWRNRARLEQIIRKEENMYRNALGLVPACNAAERKASERQSNYQPEPDAQILPTYEFRKHEK
jgi:hypothetical protein